MTPFIDLGGHAIRITEDRYSDGRKCIVAEHPDLPGCVVYADTRDEALVLLKQARALYSASVERHDGRTATPLSVAKIIQVETTSSGAGRQLQLA